MFGRPAQVTHDIGMDPWVKPKGDAVEAKGDAVGRKGDRLGAKGDGHDRAPAPPLRRAHMVRQVETHPGEFPEQFVQPRHIGLGQRGP